MSKKMWMVRAGEGAYLIDDFKEKNVVAVGWGELKDLSQVKTPDELKILVKEKYPDYKPGQLTMSAAQISKFRFDLKVGDNVLSYDPNRRVYLVGEIISEYKFEPGVLEDYNHIKKVKWLGEVDRDRLSTTTKNTLGAISTIFEIGEDSSREIMMLLQGKEAVVEETSENLDVIKEDTIVKAHEFIKDKVLNLDWEEMQELVAGLLRSMGYKTIVSPKGADRGKDIVASPDGLGLEEPRIKVEVKHRSGAMGSSQIRSFTGGLRPGDKGLYVSTGGFSKDAKYEAERSNLPVTLIDSDMLVSLIIQYYDQFDTDTKQLVPLVKIYWPV